MSESPNPSPPAPPDRPREGPRRSTFVRLGLMATLFAAALYLVVFWQPGTPLDTSGLARYEPPQVLAPEPDPQVLAQARDATREQRLFLEKEPLSHLLETAYNVQSAEAARALGMPAEPVPLATLRENPAAWRGRWLWYKGRIEELSGPKPGHPIDGASIYEATLRLPDGEPLLFTFSLPPGSGVHVGGWARAEGFLLKLRDLTFPEELQQVPLLVGAQLQRDYEDWGPVESIDPEQFTTIVDTRVDNGAVVPTQDAWRSIDEDQAVPLWHLAAYAKGRSDVPLAEWRKIAPINVQAWDAFKRDEVARGTPMRILGTLVMLRSIAAKPNPARIETWTEAWVQVRDLVGKTIPVWVPGHVDARIGEALEVRGYYFRRYAYESRRGDMYWTPLFVAGDLDRYRMDLTAGMREIGYVVVAVATLLIALAFWNNRRELKKQAAAEDALIERRRRRRVRAASVPS